MRQNVGALQPVGAIAVQENDAGGGGLLGTEERNEQLLLAAVGDGKQLVG
jgi:hypothetical protein